MQMEVHASPAQDEAHHASHPFPVCCRLDVCSPKVHMLELNPQGDILGGEAFGR